MRVSVDHNKCEGHGLCEQIAPEIFELDDEGNLTNHYEGRDIDAPLVDAARRAVASCPVAALIIHE